MFLTVRLTLCALVFSIMTVPVAFGDEMSLLRKQATAGDAASQYLLALKYDTGDGVVQDYQEALSWYRKSAEQGMPAARNNLGVLYQLGQGAPQDFKEARSWYELAAEQGFAPAEYNLGLIYGGGMGVTQDYAKARFWYLRAAGRGSAAARSKLDGLPPIVTNTVAVVQAPAKNPTGTTPLAPDVQIRQSANQGSAEARTRMGKMYLSGVGAPRDLTEALRWFHLAADQGYAPAQNELGTMYFNGEGVTTNYAEALRCFLPAAEQGYSLAQNNLGVLYQQGLGGLIQDFPKSSLWFRLAADQCLICSQRNMGTLYFNGLGVPKNDQEARRLLTLAANQGDAAATILLKKVINGDPFAR